MALRLFNTMGRKKQLFRPIYDKEVRFYSCGPTIYTYVHLGNFLKETQSNLLRNYLKFKGYKVIYVSNITDIEDKIIAGAKKEGINFRELTAKYIPYFFEDLASMKIDPPDIIPKATEHIDDMVTMIKKLMEKGHAYRGEDGSIYYKISSFKKYGKLSGIKFENLKAGARVKQDSYTKEDAHDFALWKAWDPEDEDAYWETELGKGRPGWHIECSAMSTKYLGEHFDIHSGGEDLIFPHHENEIAQTEGVTGKKWVNFWIHNGFLMVNGQKMSKSLGNFYTLRDIIEKGYNPLAVKYLFLNAHYRSQINFTFEALKNAEISLKKLVEFMQRLDQYKAEVEYNKNIPKIIALTLKEFEKAMDDDLNTPKAWTIIHDFVKKINIMMDKKEMNSKNAQEVIDFMNKIDSVFKVINYERLRIPDEVMDLVKEREIARKQKDWAKADRIREEIKKLGWNVDDTADGQKLKKI